MEVLQEMGMTNEQWYADLRNQLEDWEDVRELVQQTPDSPEKELALKKIDRTMKNYLKEQSKRVCRWQTLLYVAVSDYPMVTTTS